MASCDDDFSLLGDDSNPNHHLPHAPTSHHIHQPYEPPHRLPTRTPPVHAPPSQPALKDKVNDGEDHADDGDDYENAAAAAFCSNPFDRGTDQTDIVTGAGEKRKDHSDEHRDGGGEGGAPYSYKKSKALASASGDYRKDREEWSDTAILCLLDAYLDKLTQLNRGNLRGRDWEEVAAIVSEKCERQRKSIEQCKNKVDNLKKRYKLERHRMSGGGVSASHWPWFQKMEQIVGNSVAAKATSDDDKGVSSSGNTPRQSKRYGMMVSSPVGQMNKVKSAPTIKWRRVVFKISGAALAGAAPNNVDSRLAMLIAREVALACRNGVEVAIVVGGRNFFCGDAWVTATGLDRSTAYQIGMMATVMNSVLLQSALEKMGVQTRVQTAFSMHEVAEPYNRQRAIRHLEKGRVVIFAGIGAGTGNPIFSTDTAAALQALESMVLRSFTLPLNILHSVKSPRTVLLLLTCTHNTCMVSTASFGLYTKFCDTRKFSVNAEAVLKGTNVDGVYDCNSQDNNFTFEHISFRELVTRGATSMDSMALNFCEEHRFPVVVFNLLEPGNISKALCGEQVGTLIDQTGRIS